MSGEQFGHYYARQRQKLEVMLKDNEFMYPNNEPWPESSFDYPYGQAPTVSNLPPEERDDWQAHVGDYYINNALGTTDNPTPFGIKSAEFAREKIEKNGLSGYAKISDEDFLQLICEGLYSKYLGPLDPQDEELFGVKSDEKNQYLKSDQTCMRVVKKPWEGEYVAPSIAIVRRDLPLTDENKWNYELVAIALAEKDDTGEYAFRPDLVFDAKDHQSSSAWWLAKYYVLQGAIHRINLVDHIKVHFPNDTVNGITKSVLPKWHLLQQLLLPHLRLTLPVNNVVLEGQRSIINRDTWYPWSPVTANGEEIRKLIPFSWGGYDYYFNEKNSSYPRFCYSTNPNEQLDANHPDAEPVPTFIGLKASRYAEYLADYWEPILEYCTKVIDQLPEPPSNPQASDLEWLEIQRWAHEISKLLPGFPDENAICDKEVLSKVCAQVIWNAAVVHSADHSQLHMMIDKYPVPFILRVKPPSSNSVEVEETVADALGEKGVKYLVGAMGQLEGVLGKLVLKKLESVVGTTLFPLIEPKLKELVEELGEKGEHLLGDIPLKEGTVPLCWPTDFIYCKMADLLFYRPHNTTLLYDCDYQFLQTPDKDDEKLEAEWRAMDRPVLTEQQKATLKGIHADFQQGLDAVNAKYYDEKGAPVLYPETNPDFKPSDIPCPMDLYGLPKLKPGSDDMAKENAVRQECCLGASIQY